VVTLRRDTIMPGSIIVQDIVGSWQRTVIESRLVFENSVHQYMWWQFLSIGSHNFSFNSSSMLDKFRSKQSITFDFRSLKVLQL
jgi:hypothetical protein